jgi:hypothetical protein
MNPTDWYSIKYRDNLSDGQTLDVTSPIMEREIALSFIAQMVAKRKPILGVIKNQIVLDVQTVEQMKVESKHVRPTV